MSFADAHPEHSRTSCSDADLYNADPHGSSGCARCTALMMDKAQHGFERGWFCAVSILIRENGLTTDAESLFKQGGDWRQADPEDIVTFRECGLIQGGDHA